MRACRHGTFVDLGCYDGVTYSNTWYFERVLGWSGVCAEPNPDVFPRIASQAGRDGGGPGAAAYATGKGAVMTFTRSMAKELGPKGIRVNAVCPGMIATSFHDRFSKDEVREKVAGMTPLRREGQADEVAEVVSFLASEEAAFLTGVSLDVNGGLLFS